MMKSKWAPLVIAIVIIVGILWATGGFQNMLPSGVDESAAAINTMKVSVAATAIQKVVTDVSTASAAKDAQGIENAKPEYAAAVAAIAEVIPRFQTSINNAINRGKNVGAAQKAYTDMTTRFSYLQSSTLTLQNAKIDLTNLNAIYADISSIRTVLQAVK